MSRKTSRIEAVQMGEIVKYGVVVKILITSKKRIENLMEYFQK